MMHFKIPFIHFFLKKKNTYLFFFSLLFCLITHAPVHSKGKDAISYSYFEDKTDTLSLKKITEPTFKFIPLANNSLTIGFIPHSAWMKIELKKTPKERLLIIENAHVDELEIYLFSENKLIKSYSSGDFRPFQTRNLNYNFFNFIITEDTDRILIKAKNKGIMLLPVKIMPFNVFFNYYQNYTLIHWFYFGFVVLAIGSNLLFFFWLKESIYFYYVLCVFAIGFITAVDFGYTFQIFWPTSPVINHFNTSFYCSAFFIVLFTEKILNIKTNLPKFYYLFLAVYFFFFIAFIFSLIGYYFVAIQMIYYLALTMPVLSLTSGTILFIRSKSETSRFFLVGWSGYFISMFVYMAALENIIPYTTFSANAMQLGSSVEILFLNLAILSKINALKKEKETILSEQNKILEEKVQERTLDLHEKTDEIIAQNEELQNQQTELEAQRDTLEAQNRIIEEQNILLKGSKQSLEKLLEIGTEELKITNQELTDYNNRLEQFAFVTAHNLRGPVATLLGLAQIYNREDLTDPVNLTILNKANETTEKLDVIIKDLAGILDLQKNASNLTKDINIHHVLSDVQILLSKEIEETNALIEYNFDDTTIISGVSVYINNIFYNLVSNSIKYRKENVRPSIKIEYLSENDAVILKFSDNGRGIDIEKYGDKLFHPYKRFHLDKEGKGLGLYIVKTQVEIMKGTIDISSAPDNGCIFSITLPVKKSYIY
jgi:signal transduction histidine kinase